jgi:hypothetical protein
VTITAAKLQPLSTKAFYPLFIIFKILTRMNFHWLYLVGLANKIRHVDEKREVLHEVNELKSMQNQSDRLK